MNTTDNNWQRRAFFLLAGIALFRLIYAWIYPFDISGDEAYYWDWGRHLDWGYYSKPPLIGWIMALLRFLHVDSAQGIRMASALIGTGTLSLIYLLGARLFSPRAGFWALCVSATTIGNTVLNICMTTDAPLTLCWCGALYSFWRCTERPCRRWWVALLLFMGVGALAKQMMLIFFPIVLICLALTPAKRGLLRKPQLWVTWAASLLFLLPSLWWNSKHSWITFQHTSDHLTGDPFHLVSALMQLLEFIGAQLALVTPVTLCVLVAVFVILLRNWQKLRDAERYLLLFSAPPLFLFLLFSLHRVINPNWPLVFYLGGLVLLAGVCCERGGRLYAWFRKGVWIGAAMAAGFYIVMAVLPHTGLDTTRIVPLGEVSGWKEYGQTVARIQSQLPDGDDTLLIALGHRYNAAALAFYHPDRPQVYWWNKRPGIQNQYDLWPGPDQPGKNALLILRDNTSIPGKLEQRFATISELTSFEIPEGAHRAKRYVLYYATGWKN